MQLRIRRSERGAAGILDEFENLTLAETVIRDRIAYRRAVREGKSVLEMKPQDGKAAAEMTNLYEEVFNVKAE